MIENFIVKVSLIGWWFMAHGSWRKGALGPPRVGWWGCEGGRRRWGPLEPWAMSLELLTTNRRLINELFDYTLNVLSITKQTFHVFKKILLPYPRFSRFHWRDLHDLSVPVFSHKIKILDVHQFGIYKNNIFKSVPGNFLILFRYPGVS